MGYRSKLRRKEWEVQLAGVSRASCTGSPILSSFRKKVEQFFEPSVNAIVECIKDTIAVVAPSNPVKTVFLLS